MNELILHRGDLTRYKEKFTEQTTAYKTSISKEFLQDIEEHTPPEGIEIHEAYKYIYKHHIEPIFGGKHRGCLNSNWKRFFTWICEQEGMVFHDPHGEYIIQYNLDEGVKSIHWTGEDK